MINIIPFLLVGLASLATCHAQAMDAETTPAAFGSVELPQSCRTFWDQILNLPAGLISSGKLTQYPTLGSCHQVPPAFRWNHDQYAKHCEPDFAAKNRSPKQRYTCGEAALLYRINLRGWKHRDRKDLDKLPPTEAVELLLHLLAYSEREYESIPRYTAALQIARRLSSASEANVETAFLHFSAANRLRLAEKNDLRRKEVQETVALLIERIQAYAWYPHKKLRGIGAYYIENAHEAMKQMGEGDSARKQLAQHPNTRYWALYFEGCTQIGKAREELFQQAALLPEGDDQIQKFIDRTPADQCRSIRPRLTKTIEMHALALGIEIPWELAPLEF